MAGKSAITGLLAAAKEESENMKNVKSVATGEINSEESKEIQKKEERKEPSGETEQAVIQGLFEQILKKREEKDNEIVRIPRSVHKELKILSSITGVPIGHLVANFIEAGMKQFEKELTSLKKKYIKEL